MMRNVDDKIIFIEKFEVILVILLSFQTFNNLITIYSFNCFLIKCKKNTSKALLSTSIFEVFKFGFKIIIAHFSYVSEFLFSSFSDLTYSSKSSFSSLIFPYTPTPLKKITNGVSKLLSLKKTLGANAPSFIPLSYKSVLRSSKNWFSLSLVKSFKWASAL
jgi:hypothetical protein